MPSRGIIHEQPYDTNQPERAAIDAMAGTVALEFGTDWCGFCKGAAPRHRGRAGRSSRRSRHIKVEDGPGRALGRSFRVKLWPTVIVLKDGKELARVVRPADSAEVARGAGAGREHLTGLSRAQRAEPRPRFVILIACQFNIPYA